MHLEKDHEWQVQDQDGKAHPLSPSYTNESPREQQILTIYRQHGTSDYTSLRWTGPFDHEARASLMSTFIRTDIVPRSRTEHQQWHRSTAESRETWLAHLEKPDPHGSVWTGQFDVESRSSWQLRDTKSSLSSLNTESSGRKLSKLEPSVIADNKIVTQEVLECQFEGSGTKTEPFLVTWTENDPANPINLTRGTKYISAVLLALACFIVSVASSGFSQGVDDMMSEFGVSRTMALLSTSAFLIGFAAGALVLSPMSEVYGRRDFYYSTFGAFMVFGALTGLVPTMTLILFFRFLAGVAGSFTQTVAPAIAADMFDVKERGIVLSVFTLAGLLGSNLGPIICGFLDAAYRWRSIVMFLLAASFPIWIGLLLSLPETFAPVLLQRRAKALTKLLDRHHSVAGVAPKSIMRQLRVGVIRPWIMLFYEPIVTLLSLFLAVVHGTLFMLFAAYPIVFQQVRGWRQGVASLPLLAICLGTFLAMIYTAIIDQPRYARVLQRTKGYAPPEARLPPAMLGGAVFPIGLFWFAWSNSPTTHWLIPVSAGVLFGFGMALLYLSLNNYLVDAYLGYSASALAASTVLRSVGAAIFPLFATSMYDSLGIHWASSIPGFLALLFTPCLLAFYTWGHNIRKRTKFGAEAAKLASTMH